MWSCLGLVAVAERPSRVQRSPIFTKQRSASKQAHCRVSKDLFISFVLRWRWQQQQHPSPDLILGDQRRKHPPATLITA
jgi:hypothetical protein